MMLTALNNVDQSVIDLTRFRSVDPLVQSMNGQRIAQRNGYDLVCRGCFRPTHLVTNQHGRMFFRHNPGHAGGCIFEEVTHLSAGQTEHHIMGKTLLVAAIRDLTGWSADPEQRYDDGVDVVVVDVAATYQGAIEHAEQGRYAWEIQLSPQTQGDFSNRTTTIERVTNRRARWLTPYAAQAGSTVSMICNPDATHVVDRVYESLEPEVKSPPFELGRLVRAIHRSRPNYAWFQGGEYGEWLIANRSALGGRADDPTLLRRRHRPNTSLRSEDTRCEREPIQTAAVPPPMSATEVSYHDFGPGRCAICGTFVDQPYGFGSDPPQCRECFYGVRFGKLRLSH